MFTLTFVDLENETSISILELEMMKVEILRIEVVLLIGGH